MIASLLPWRNAPPAHLRICASASPPPPLSAVSLLPPTHSAIVAAAARTPLLPGVRTLGARRAQLEGVRVPLDGVTLLGEVNFQRGRGAQPATASLARVRLPVGNRHLVQEVVLRVHLHDGCPPAAACTSLPQARVDGSAQLPRHTTTLRQFDRLLLVTLAVFPGTTASPPLRRNVLLFSRSARMPLHLARPSAAIPSRCPALPGSLRRSTATCGAGGAPTC